jgi:prepilin-type N-terminal cleavage/methylation domain-containing protein
VNVKTMKNENTGECWSGGVGVENTKHQTPNTRETPIPKLKGGGAALEISGARAKGRAGYWLLGRPCDPQSSILNPQSPAFTLIELLVVIAIVAILAALVVGGASVGIAVSHRSRAQAELSSMSAAIDAYKQKRGYYPPCNISNSPSGPIVRTTYSSLFYELTGVITTNQGSSQIFHSLLTQENLTQPANGAAGPLTVEGLFGTGGINNSSPDPTEIQNFYPAMKNYQHGALYQTDGSGPTYTLMMVSIHGPRDFPNTSSQIYNFWNYVSSQNAAPAHNKNTYDLWVDILIRGKTNRISNWSSQPEIVND